MRWIFLLPLLVGCSANDQIRLQQTLDEYALLSAQSRPLASVLTGEALQSAQRSSQLLQDLKISQRGLAEFEVWSAEAGVGSGCLDLSEVELVNEKGELVNPARPDRVEFQAHYADDLISSLVISERPC